MLERGQQIVNGTLDVMRLNLVQIFYTLFLLLTTFFFNQRMFPFSAGQGGMIAFFTVVVPTAVMSFWAPKGRVNQGRFGRVLRVLSSHRSCGSLRLSSCFLIISIPFMGPIMPGMFLPMHWSVWGRWLRCSPVRPGAGWRQAGPWRSTADPWQGVCFRSWFSTCWSGFPWPKSIYILLR